jgi:hypothetical protein
VLEERRMRRARWSRHRGSPRSEVRRNGGVSSPGDGHERAAEDEERRRARRRRTLCARKWGMRRR